mmetsp:Transcript_2348/g.5398  ORF Transcript_2348/g.5398 Transcript_2348/m.5398 type:complete len:212 (-) Transcript_2348:1016-1651(-)
MFRGTDMSTSINLRCKSCRSTALRMGSLLPVAVKTTSLERITSSMLSAGATLAFAPPRLDTSSSKAWARSVDLLTKVSCTLGSLLNKAMRRSLDILPAPTMHTCTLLVYLRKSVKHLAIINSTAALETDTEPLPIFVLVRTSLPMRMPAFSIFAMIFPPDPAMEPSASGSSFWMQCSWQALTCARIWASPSTSESKPELTSKRWFVAASPE